MNKKIVTHKEMIAFHPGQYIWELTEDYQMTQREFADRLEVSAKTISKLVNGEEAISNDIAQKLAELTHISMIAWINLQNSYDTKVAKGSVPWN